MKRKWSHEADVVHKNKHHWADRQKPHNIVASNEDIPTAKNNMVNARFVICKKPVIPKDAKSTAEYGLCIKNMEEIQLCFKKGIWSHFGI